ncbi:hypothetical protein [Wolbachia endosymbiont (group B) of Apotomis betuletana]|uniref:hypothetical protein n=1 Tax=Wolbachia endosymbiont (group B) of Apotomis betuletana TaxID=2953982 RepID=UPI002227A78F|nr:hypothetical protein [Wolbachia endosymbiont (group B) of Apotomis betuletana]
MASLTFKDNSGANVPSPNIESIIYEDAAQNKYTFGVDNATNVFNTFKYEPNGAAEIDYSATATNFMTGGAIATLLGIGTNVDAIKTKTDSIPADLSADLVTIKTQVGTDLISGIKAKTDKITDTLGADVTAIKAKTDTIPADLTAKVTAIETATNAANLGDKVTAIQTKTDKITDTFTADVAAIKDATSAANLGNKVTAIQTKTDKMPDDLNDELIKLTTIGNAINGNGHVTAAAKAVLESSFKKAIKEAGEDGSEWLRNEIKEIVSQPSFEIPTDSSSPLSWDW